MYIRYKMSMQHCQIGNRHLLQCDLGGKNAYFNQQISEFFMRHKPFKGHTHIVAAAAAHFLWASRNVFVLRKSAAKMASMLCSAIQAHSAYK